jgi:hypothetical protein
MEGRLRRVTERCWEGWLHGDQVQIGGQGGQWYVWLAPDSQWTERCLRVGSLAERAKLAREWMLGLAKTSRVSENPAEAPEFIPQGTSAV